MEVNGIDIKVFAKALKTMLLSCPWEHRVTKNMQCRGKCTGCWMIALEEAGVYDELPKGSTTTTP